MNLLDVVNAAMKPKPKLSKTDIGRILHDETSTEEEVQEALDALGADDYENLED